MADDIALRDIVAVSVLDGYRLRIRFDDGVEGDVDIADLVPFTGVFEPVKSRQHFAAVRVHPELGTIYWPSGADLDPDVLYSRITGKPIGTRAGTQSADLPEHQARSEGREG